MGTLRLILFLLLFAGAASAEAEQRYALLIGNWEYDGACPYGAPSDGSMICDLNSPRKDVPVIAAALLEVGFPVENIITLKNGTKAEIERAIDDFAARLDEGDVGFFYYSGHGASMDISRDVGRENFLIPTGGRVRVANDLPGEAVAVNAKVFETLEARTGATIFVVLDACRTSLQTLKPDGSKSVGAGTLTKGVVPVERKGSDLFVVYAAAEGDVAYDDSEFSETLRREIVVPYRTAIETFGVVARDVKPLGSNNARRIELSPGNGGLFCFARCREWTPAESFFIGAYRSDSAKIEQYIIDFTIFYMRAMDAHARDEIDDELVEEFQRLGDIGFYFCNLYQVNMKYFSDEFHAENRGKYLAYRSLSERILKDEDFDQQNILQLAQEEAIEMLALSVAVAVEIRDQFESLNSM